jgi:hypothetical protein
VKAAIAITGMTVVIAADAVGADVANIANPTWTLLPK